MTHQNTMPCQVPGHDGEVIELNDSHARKRCACGRTWEVPITELSFDDLVKYIHNDDDDASGSGAGIVETDDEQTTKVTIPA